MNADKYLESIGLENVIDEEFFNNDDKSWYKVQELMESYHQAKLKLLDIPVVSNNEVAVCGLELRSCEYIGFSNRCNYAHECPHKEQTDC